MPGLFYSLSGLNDQSGLLWNDRGTIWFFGGGRDLGEVPFRFTKSVDSGATWSELCVPVFRSRKGPFTAQPINSAFRDADGTIYVGCDGEGGSSLLFASEDEGRSWYDTGGRTGGRHTTFVLLKDGRILGMGGKNTDIDRHMPMFYSSDRGRTWSVAEKSPFAALGSNQRPKILRLASGRLFFAGDFQSLKLTSEPPAGDIGQRGAYVALSDDEGRSWSIKKVEAAPCHAGWRGIGRTTGKPQHGFGTLGYCDAVQSPDGLIHLMTSKGRPSMHFAMNEAWILSEETGECGHTTSMAAGTGAVIMQEDYPDGRPAIVSAGFTAASGVFLLHGKEVWYDRNGGKVYEVTRRNGKKAGIEVYWRQDGTKEWQREYRADGIMVWTTYWPEGTKKSESRWVGPWAEGITTNWDRSGHVICKLLFRNGEAASFGGIEREGD
jgi:hypothetical protein